MRRTALSVLAAAMTMTAAAQDKYVIFNGNDGTHEYTMFSEIDSAAFLHGNTVASFYLKNGRNARYAVSSLESIGFEASAGAATAYASDFSSYMSAAPVSANVTEPARPTVETDPAFGDYIENFSQKVTLTFIYSGNSVTVTGSKPAEVTVEKNGAHVTVKSTKKGMTYRLQGSTSDGSFTVANMNATQSDDNNKKFAIELYGINMTNPKGPAINVQSGKTVYVKLTSGKTNTLKDGATYDVVAGESRKGTLFSEGQLIFSGEGTLNVTSLGGHGICSDDYVRLRQNTGTISITALKDGIATNDKFIMYGGKVTVNAQDDGISVSRGPLEIYGGSLTVSCTDEGLVSEYLKPDTTCVTIAGGSLNITTTGAKGHAVYSTGKLSFRGGALSATVRGDASKCINAAGDITVSKAWAMLETSGIPQYDEEELDYSSAAAIRAKKNLSITGSTVAIHSTADGSKGINASGSVSIEGSTVTILTDGDNYKDIQNVRSRAIDAASLTIGSATLLNIDAAMTAINTEEGLTVAGGHTYAYTASPSAKCLNVKGTMSQTGGMILYGTKD